MSGWPGLDAPILSNLLKSYPIYPHRKLLNSPYAVPVSPSVPTPYPLRLTKSLFGDTPNIITLGTEAVAQIRSITDGNAPSTTEQVMMSAQTGGRHVDTLKSPA